MFDEQFHNFIASSRTSLPTSLSFPLLHGSSSISSPTNFLTFDPLFFPSHHQTLLQSHLRLDEQKEEDDSNTTAILATNPQLERERSVIDPSWSNDEVLALLRIKSSLENWFTDFTWEHVSRKLAEVGYKRSAEKCKEKYEEETCRNFNAIAYNKNNRFLISELDEQLYHGENHHHHHVSDSPEKNQTREEPSEEEEKEDKIQGQQCTFKEHPKDLVVPSQEDEQVVEKSTKSKKRKRKNAKKFEMFKGLCVDIVNKMMAQQEEMHNKLLEDMVQRDEQKIEREEEWKRQEMERLNKEIEMRAQEQVIAGDRQSTIIEFIKQFTSSDQIQFSLGIICENPNKYQNPLPISPSNPSSTTLATEIPKVPFSSTLPLASQNPKSGKTKNIPLPTTTPNSSSNTSSTTLSTEIPKIPFSSTLSLASQNKKSGNTQNNPLPSTTPVTSQNPNSATSNGKEDIGKRWPRDEVLALINIRCSLYSGSISNNEEKDGGFNIKGGSLWERISQGMLELGYKRSAKRCKEKWENINKYFRKTKDVNKKRSVDSRTCPYFHQLSSLYNQGMLVAASPGDELENCSSSLPENHALPETAMGSTQGENSAANVHVQEPALTFEF